jgi:NADH dehydrogenase (ubiquinone) flavoprotein 2
MIANWMLRRASLMRTQTRAMSAFANHRDTADNLESSPFEFTPESFEAIQVLLTKYPDNYKSSAVIPTLFLA